MPGDYDIEYASPWAGANYFPVGKPGSALQKFEKATWAELERICRQVPEAGIHFQNTRVYGREKDAGTATGQWFEELTKEDAWFKDVVPNVCCCVPLLLDGCDPYSQPPSSVSCPKANSQKTVTPAPNSHPFASTLPSTCPGSLANV